MGEPEPSRFSAFQQRVRARALAREEAERFEQQAATFARIVDSLAQKEDMQKRRYPTDQDIASRYRAYSKVTNEVMEAPPLRELPESEPVSTVADQIEEDRRANILFQLYTHYVAQAGNDTRLDYDEFNEVVAGRALVRLLALFKFGRDILATLYTPEEDHLIPQVADAQRFYNAGGLDVIDPGAEGYAYAVTRIDGDRRSRELWYERFLSDMYQQIPGSRRAVGRILGEYGRCVRRVRSDNTPRLDSPLPYEQVPNDGFVTWNELTNLFGTQITLPEERAEAWDWNLERAICDYIEGTPYRDAGKKYGIPRGKLRQALESRGLLRQRKGAA